MSNYIIPDGWNPMTEPWEEGRIVNVISKDGILSSTTKDEAHLRGTFFVAWQYPVPLEKKRRFEIGRHNEITYTKEAFYWVKDMITGAKHASYIYRKDVAELIAKYLEENEP